ncbi:DMT family transporter [Halobacterium sp. R2-5]|uniref:EamA family transporter n=1 Tax=Halobacterium sp. R2-5 TaxID=2715751 RepID=UPI0014212A07|nr:DMT family transporter [Halobacterium sp. R2-5]
MRVHERLPSVSEDTAGVALVCLSAVCFGLLGIFGVYAQQAGLSVPTLLAGRFAVASVVVWALLAATGRARLLRGRALAAGLALGGLGYAAMNGLYFYGLEFMTAGMVAIVLYTYPAFVVVLALLVVGERITRTTVLALALSLGGVALAVGANAAGASVPGVLVVLGASVAYAAYITVSRQLLRDTDPVVLTAHVVPAAGVSFAGFGLATGTLAVPSTPSAWAVVAGIAILSTVIPVFAFFAGLQRIGASRSSIVSTVEPPTTVAFGALLFGEPVTVVTVAGGAMVLAAVVILNRE